MKGLNNPEQIIIPQYLPQTFVLKLQLAFLCPQHQMKPIRVLGAYGSYTPQLQRWFVLQPINQKVGISTVIDLEKWNSLELNSDLP